MTKKIDGIYLGSANLENTNPVVNHFLESYEGRCLFSSSVLELGVYVNNNNPKDILRVCSKEGDKCQVRKISEDASETGMYTITEADIFDNYFLLMPPYKTVFMNAETILRFAEKYYLRRVYNCRLQG